MTTVPFDPGPRPELTWLPVGRLDIDPAYQRAIDTRRSQRLIGKIAANFRWAAFQAILAGPSGPERWLIIDGQHRVAAAARRYGLAATTAAIAALGDCFASEKGGLQGMFHAYPVVTHRS